MIAETLSTFFDTESGHAVTATYYGSDVDGIFYNDFILNGPVQDSAPMFQCAAADVSGVEKGDTITIAGTLYEVVEPQPDGTGVIVLVLHEA